VTSPLLTTEDMLTRLTELRSWCATEAAYYRRRADTPRDRQLAIQLEEWVAQLDDVVANVRMARRSDPATP